MSLKKNELWKLDYLEAKFHNATPRFSHTKKLLGAKNNNQLLKKLPNNVEDADIQIAALKSEYFERKYYGGYKKLDKEVKKVVLADMKKFASDDAKASIVNFFENDKNTDLLITSKLIKMIMNILLNSKELKQTPPAYISSASKSIIVDKTNVSHPSAFFINNCQKNPILNNYISNLWNSKTIKPLLLEIEWSFKLIRGGITKIEREARDKQVGKNGKDEKDDESDSGSEDDDSDSENEQEEFKAKDFEDAYEKFAKYDKLVGDSDEEEESIELDGKIDYNQVTDEEASDLEDDSQDSFFEEDSKPTKSEKVKKVKHNLPELASGYYSGGSDEEDDIDNDKVVKEITQTRKNRRGQRARQKIWEQKYGKEAKHVKEERQKVASEREQRQKDFEERERKRQLKHKIAMENAPSGSNIQPLGARVPGSSHTPAAGAPEILHPSWVAKKLAEDKQKNVKFAGKKITFD